MKRETVLALNAINTRFYRERAEEFSETRERPWRGWEQLFDRLQPPLGESPSILDVGCGNGRLARFLRNRLGAGFTYTGVDASSLALAEARRRLGDDAELFEHDFIAGSTVLPDPLGERRFDLVVLFGVLHHVPARAHRARLLRDLSPHVADRLVFTVWLFEAFERFRKKLVPWQEADVLVDLQELEPGDHIMTWGNAPPGYRYCHAVSEEEESELIAGLRPDVTLADRFEPEREPNRYVVLARAGEVQ